MAKVAGEGKPTAARGVGGGARPSYASLRPKGGGGVRSGRRAGSGARFQRVQCCGDADEEEDEVESENIEL